MKKKVIFILSTFLVELLSRITYKETYYDKIIKILNPNPILIWETKPNLNTTFESANLKTNSLGFRNKEILSKTKKRIIIMGASPSFGWGVNEEKTYPYILGQKLKNYEIINASVIGYSSSQGKILFKTVIKKLNPDIIIFAYGINDPDKYRFFKNYDYPDEYIINSKDNTIIPFEWISKSYFIKQISLYLVHKNILTPNLHSNKRVDLNQYLENIKYFEKESKENKFKLILLTSPFHEPPLKEVYNKNKTKSVLIKNRKEELLQIYQDVIAYNKIMKLYAQKNSIICIDLFSIFSNKKELFLNPEFDMVHFSEKGHHLISNILYSYIFKNEP